MVSGKCKYGDSKDSTEDENDKVIEKSFRMMEQFTQQMMDKMYGNHPTPQPMRNLSDMSVTH